ncbi:MAG: hypothetical protein RL065_1805 [Bacteroidota bacterium]|jgi:hypothetical protein
MQINYTVDAFASLSNVVNFIESQNTFGAGSRWLDKFEKHLLKSFITPESIHFCNNKAFHQLKLRCINFNDWIIAFSIQDTSVLIEAILHTSRLTD